MKKTISLVLIITMSFLFGFGFKTAINNFQPENNHMKKVTGIGGIFFKCKDPNAIKAWYQENLGLPTNDYGATFEWYEAPDSAQKASTQWSPFKETSKYFEPSSKEFMINYRVDNLEALVTALKKKGVTIVDEMESYDFGKFIHIMDPEGNKIELWEPKD